ncbi:hypothetical protein CHIBA101_0132 [Actinomyces sp. Chiba101]|uniref:DUF4244 domain-containing protein n=1 Tax=Actinomyces denticolens TaxID=52767 RepID=A0ABY1IEX7_9ACTO|nr:MULTISPECIES: DUF4244 domain-containing protein [Actinomyces]BAW92007.1 hypothetical protein CHIBA101_0132 [Actinomyces sp. Chiba101]GAV95061.1 hypothetical protein ADENT20671_1839 [Actinomyces denticolens]SHJ07690.1 Protein of unknown function [Actinomyces denticolens]SUU12021.1 Uncharacterised protein [Actinomyces denticolens]
MKNALLTLHRAWGLAHPGAEYALLTGPIAAALERAEAASHTSPDGEADPTGEAGMATAEYAIGTLAAAAFAGLLLAIMRSGSLRGTLQSLIESALSVG